MCYFPEAIFAFYCTVIIQQLLLIQENYHDKYITKANEEPLFYPVYKWSRS